MTEHTPAKRDMSEDTVRYLRTKRSLPQADAALLAAVQEVVDDLTEYQPKEREMYEVNGITGGVIGFTITFAGKIHIEGLLVDGEEMSAKVTWPYSGNFPLISLRFPDMRIERFKGVLRPLVRVIAGYGAPPEGDSE